MTQSPYDRIDAYISRENPREAKSRADYYAQRLLDPDYKDEFSGDVDAYVAERADLAQWGSPETDEAIAAAQAICPLPFPEALRNFYKERGSFAGTDEVARQLTIHSPARLVADHHADDDSMDKCRSMGLADMILHTWGNDRVEIDSWVEDDEDDEDYESSYSAAEIEYFNLNYAVVGYALTPNWGYESHEYIYFDKDGRFGVFQLHQDEFDVLERLLGESPATKTWEEALNELLDTVLADDDD